MAANPDEREGNGQDEDADDVQIIPPPTGTPTTATASNKGTPASSAPPSMKESNARKEGEAYTVSGSVITKRGRGRPRKIQDEENSATGGSAKVTGAATRKGGRPPKRNVDTAPRTVVDDFRIESITKRIKRNTHPGKYLTSPYKPS